jgi:uncharacterized RDD family membrane protein YckC
MDHIGIETAQNVMLSHETASVGDRVIAYILDTLVQVAWLIVWMMIIFAAGLGGAGVFVFVLLVIALFPYVFYHLVCELAMDGQSIGKRVRKIKVVRIDGGQATVGQYLLRWVLRIVDNFYGLGLLVLLVNGKGQRIGDLAAGTTVISLKSRVRHDQTLLATLPQDHVIRYPQAVHLSDAQASMIKEVLDNRNLDTHAQLVLDMARKVQSVLGIDPGELLPQRFLETVLRDHIKLTSGQAAATFDGRTAGPGMG